MDDSSDDDLEIGPQKSAEELLRERERLAEAHGDVVDVGADDADAAMPPAPVQVKPEAVKPERKPHLAYEDEAMEAPPVDEEEPEHAPEPWWKKLQGKKRPSKAPEALAAELKELSIAAARARAARRRAAPAGAAGRVALRGLRAPRGRRAAERAAGAHGPRRGHDRASRAARGPRALRRPLHGRCGANQVHAELPRRQGRLRLRHAAHAPAERHAARREGHS